MLIHDEESQINYYTIEKERKTTNALRFKAQREQAWVRSAGEEKTLASQKTNKRIPRMISLQDQLATLGISDVNAWKQNYKKRF